MKKYIIGGIVLLVVGYLIYKGLAMEALFASLLGGGVAMNNAVKQAKLEQKAESIEEDIVEIDNKLKEDVDEKTPEEEASYWKDQ